MSKKCRCGLIAIAMVAALSLGATAAQIDFANETLVNGGSANIRGGLYTTGSSSTPYQADTKTSPAIGEGITTKIRARVIHSAFVDETRSGFEEVNAYGTVGASTHEGYSDNVYVVIDLPQE